MTTARLFCAHANADGDESRCACQLGPGRYPRADPRLRKVLEQSLIVGLEGVIQVLPAVRGRRLPARGRSRSADATRRRRRCRCPRACTCRSRVPAGRVGATSPAAVPAGRRRGAGLFSKTLNSRVLMALISSWVGVPISIPAVIPEAMRVTGMGRIRRPSWGFQPRMIISRAYDPSRRRGRAGRTHPTAEQSQRHRDQHRRTGCLPIPPETLTAQHRALLRRQHRARQLELAAIGSARHRRRHPTTVRRRSPHHGCRPSWA